MAATDLRDVCHRLGVDVSIAPLVAVVPWPILGDLFAGHRVSVVTTLRVLGSHNIVCCLAITDGTYVCWPHIWVM